MTNMIEESSALSAPAATLEHTLREAMAAVRADAVFGRPIERGETTVIPCAEVAIGMGLGGGRGGQAATEKQAAGQGEGYGGGGGGRGRPVAVIVVTRDSVDVKPVLDVSKIALAGMTTGAFITFWLARLALGTRGSRTKAPSISQLTRALRG